MVRDEIITRLYEVVEEIEEEHEFYQTIFEIGRFGPWEQFDETLLYTSNAWKKLFTARLAPESLLEYADLIDDPEDRKRVLAARKELLFQAPGTRWTDMFTLAGKPIRSTAAVTFQHTLAGIDYLQWE